MKKITNLVKSLQFWVSLAVGLIVTGFSAHSYFGSFARADDVQQLQKSFSRSKDLMSTNTSKIELLDYKLNRQQEMLDMILQNTLQIGSKLKANHLQR